MKPFENISKNEILFAMADLPLGKGEEATVFKVHTNPKYTIRRSRSLDNEPTIAQYIQESELIEVPNLFGKRNFAQTVAYLKHPTMREQDNPLISINLYSPGFSYEIAKPTMPTPTSEEALIATKVMSSKILEIPDKAIDNIYDDLHFLSSKKHSIDAGFGFFTNIGNILYSTLHQRLFPIDIQPFLKDRIGIYNEHTKGFNTPLHLTRALMPGSFSFRKEHSQDKELLEMRIEIVNKLISGAERNHLNDMGGYLGIEKDKMANIWNVQLQSINIPKEKAEAFSRRITCIKDETRYQPMKEWIVLKRVSGKDEYS
ncbi:MAG: hypothetical protein J6U64_01225 [Alphaproteobacteria bacterium]|nr:hypothetical protein [Alphaproteobacteria bacterium]